MLNNMNNTGTITQTNTYTEARARYIMDKIFEDLTGLIIREFATQTQVNKWKDDLLYLMNEEILTYFEIQFKKPDGQKLSIRYMIKADNTLSEDSLSGSLRLYSLPKGTKANLFADINQSHKNYQKVNDELHSKRGWGYGSQVEGIIERHLSFSKEGYGAERHQVGLWN